MNDKLKQSLQERLNGMRWGEREQAEVFRQIQKKEMHEVKHVKRGTSMLALAAAMLFFVMGAAFAITGAGQPDDTQPLAQSTENSFLPVPAARYENDYVTLTIDNAAWDDTEVAFDVTLHLKEPDQYGLIIGSYANPGSAGRTLLTTQMHCINEISCGGEHYENVYINTVDVLDMTPDSATVRMVHRDLPPAADKLNIVLTVEARSDKPIFDADIEFALQRDADTVAQSMRAFGWVLENELVTGYLVESIPVGEQLRVTVDILPKKPWYVINTTAPDKSTLTVTAEWYISYDNEIPLYHVVPVNPEYVATSEGARATTLIPFPSDCRSVSYHVSVTVRDAVSGSEFENYIIAKHTRAEAEVTPTLLPAPTPTPAPAPTPTPTPLVRSGPKGEHIGGTEQLSVFLENYWYDGYSAEGTLRIRADDPATCCLALAPNESGMPSKTTWVVQLDDGESEYINHFDFTMTREEITGDVIVDFTYCDLNTSGSSNPQNPRHNDPNLYYDLTITATNELTWQTESDEMTLKLAPSGNYAYRPFQLVSTTEEGLFEQAGIITTDRYHYVGVMLTYSNQYVPKCYLLDARGRLLGTSEGYSSVDGNSLTIFPRKLFPYDGDIATHYHLLAVRMEKDVPLPEELHVRITGKAQTEMNLASLVLAVEPEPMFTSSPAPTPLVSSEPKGQHIGGTEQISVYLDDYWYDGYSAEGTLRICADDPATSRLTLHSNDGSASNADTWLILLDDGEPTYQNDFDLTMTQETSTGDVIVDFVYNDYHTRSILLPDELADNGAPKLSHTFALTAVNLQTQGYESVNFKLELTPSGEHTYQPLHLVSTTADGVLEQAGITTTDRYHYISFMIHSQTIGFPMYAMTDAEGALLGTASGYLRVPGSSLIDFPWPLFPYSGDAAANYLLNVIRIDKDVTLPDMLHVRLSDSGQTELASFVLTADAATVAAAAKHEQVSIVLDKNVLFDNEHVTITFEDADYASGHAFAHLYAELKDAANDKTVEDLPHELTYLDMQLTFTGYSSEQRLPHTAVTFQTVAYSDDFSSRNFYLHGYSDQWTGDAAPAILAHLTLKAADGSIDEEYTAEFVFPNTGKVRLYDLIPTEEPGWSSFDYVSGQLADTDYLAALSIQYRCEEPYHAADISLKRGTTFTPDSQINHLLDDRTPKLYQADQLYHYLYFDPDRLDVIFTITARDAASGHLLEQLPVMLAPVAE